VEQISVTIMQEICGLKIAYRVEKLQSTVREEISFLMQTNDQQERKIATASSGFSH
jgi:hypothetical protein